MAYNKNKLFKALDYWSRNMLSFDFLEEGLGIVFRHFLCMVFSQKCFPCYIVWLWLRFRYGYVSMEKYLKGKKSIR